MTRSANSAHPAFDLINAQTVESLNVCVEQYEHRATGAAHYHLASDNSENVFLVALRTVPQDSTGVAHILEHTALCGSRRYPVRDPFFMMLRRSLNTFMNAFTSSDWTAYPFASQNRKDFGNLLDVYLDAVFFSRLDPLDFAQEGHRVEFSEPDNPDSELVYKGVVFNEMKGAMSSITSVLWDTLCANLFPTSTYHYNSGGDPEHIPDLSYDQLREFYHSHYHPSNAIFMTFGNIDAAEHQAVFEERALKDFQRSDYQVRVEPEQRLQAPLQVEERYAYDESDDTEGKTHIVIGWMLGESFDLEKALEAQLLSSVLTDNSASPLQQLLETTELGRAPSPLCGLEDSMRELVFCCGIEGSEPQHAQALESAVLGVLEKVASEGIAEDKLEAVLHQLELHQREISGDSYPYGLQLILQALGSATHYADPIAVLDLDPVIAALRAKIGDPQYIKTLARELLLDNPHRVTLVLRPDTELSAEREAREKARLLSISTAMDASERETIVKLAAQLQARQQQEDDDSILPRVELDDVPANLPELECIVSSAGSLPVTTYERGTNGIVYQQLVHPLPAMEPEQLRFLPLYTGMLTELGIGAQSYLQVQERQAATVGSIGAFTSLRGAVDDEQAISGYFTVSAKALGHKIEEQNQLIHDLMHGARFDETERMHELLQQMLARREQSVTSNGHGLAMAAACAGMSPLARLSHEQSGLAGIAFLRELNKQTASAAGRDALAAQFEAIHNILGTCSPQVLGIADAQHLQPLIDSVARAWGDTPGGNTRSALSLPPLREMRSELWLTNSQVNFCARAYPTVPVEHPDAAALTVLGGFLRNGFLHRAIREQGGAYGGGASQDSSVAAFRFYSYRDPRLAETLADFDQAVAWLLDHQHDARALEEAILGVIGSIDKPSSPAGEAKQHFHNRLFGRSHEQRERFRQAILEVTLADLCRVGDTYLKPERASTAVIAPATAREDTIDLRNRLGLELREL
ncbi:MAG: insulinase family protein [Halioglobus sp.]